MVKNSIRYVGFWRRLAAYLVDSIVLVIIFYILGIIFSQFIDIEKIETDLFSVPMMLPSIFYFIYFWCKQDGQTPGNKLLGIKVVREDGKNISVGTAILRFIGYYLSALVFLLGFLWIIWDSKKQGWHDKIAGTIVVYK